jgi:hypothetical protein
LWHTRVRDVEPLSHIPSFDTTILSSEVRMSGVAETARGRTGDHDLDFNFEVFVVATSLEEKIDVSNHRKDEQSFLA